MPVFKCPVCKRMHVVQRYDTDFVCTNSQSQKKKFQNLVKEDNFEQNNWNMNEWRTKEDVYKDVFIDDIKTVPSDKNKYAGGLNNYDW